MKLALCGIVIQLTKITSENLENKIVLGVSISKEKNAISQSL
ncbi:hypothetical protein HMPREF3037_02533 [Candidatus Stoquefichus sp. KLE1796]|nr:hypothetical protein HMPREF3037_02533 [Candidatus Stoquefichus sp. KLE1796]